MTDTVHVTKSAGQADANVSAVSISDLAALIGNNTPTVDPFTPGALWNDSGTVKVSLTPLAITLLDDNEYKIDGVSKELADCYTPGYDGSGDSATIGIVTNEGYELNWVGGGVATFASASLVATAGLEAVLDPVVGYSGVFDVSAVTLNAPTSFYYSQIQFTGGAAGCEVDIGIAPNATYDEAILKIRTGTGVGVVVYPLGSVTSGVIYRVAFSISATKCSVSVNGNDVVSTEDFPVNYTVGFSPNILVALQVGGPDSIGGQTTFKHVRYYPLVTDMAGLKRMSTP